MRPPIIAVLGHVDHGKTTLLDALRRTSLAAGADGNGLLVLGSFDSGNFGFFVNFNYQAGSRRQGGADKFNRIIRIFNDIDFFAAELVDDGLDADAFLADAGADGINAFFVAFDGNFGAAAGFADALENDLFGGLGGDAAESGRGNVFVFRI